MFAEEMEKMVNCGFDYVVGHEILVGVVVVSVCLLINCRRM